MNTSKTRVPLPDPLSKALLPLVLGLTRRGLLRAGVTEGARRLNNILVHYYHLAGLPGSRPETPVVLIHGIADNALTWAFTMRSMARIGPVYAIDLPGFGQSGYPPGRRYATIAEHTEVVRAFINEVVGRPTLIVGNSMGGWIAARLALETPQNILGIVLLDPGGALLEGLPSWEPFVQAVALSDLRAVRKVYRQMFGRVPLPLYLGQRSFQDIFTRDPVSKFVADSIERFTTLNQNEFFQPEDLRAITVPTALIWGSRDTFLPRGSFEFFRDNLPNANLLLLKGCGHLPQRERPRQVVRFVKSFVKQRLARPSSRDAVAGPH